MTLTVYLVPAARGRYELYSEPPDGDDEAHVPAEMPGRFRRWLLGASRQWHEWVERARHGADEGRFARLRDQVIRALAESIAEQRTLWALRHPTAVSARFPRPLDAVRAKAVVTGVLSHARRHHLRWLIVDLLIFVGSGALMPIPGPNVVAFYFAFRVVGHWQSWRGAKQGLAVATWTYEAEDGLSELADLVDLPREARAARVEAIAERLNLQKLSAFFDRVAIPSP